jgi:hypothetical protein
MFLEWFFNIFNLVISFSLSLARPLDSRKLNDKADVYNIGAPSIKL